MSDPLQDLASVEGLPSREAVICRALIRHQFVEPDKVLEAARAAAAGECDGVLPKLTAEGNLDQKRADGIQKALEKKIEQKRAEAEDSLPVAETAQDQTRAKVKSRRMWKKKERWSPPPPGDKSTEGSSVVLLGAIREETARKRRERAIAFLERYLRSRTHELVLTRLVRQKEGPAILKRLMRQTGASHSEIAHVLEDFRSRGLLKTVGEYPYYYEPTSEQQEETSNFMKVWNDPSQHAGLLKRLLELEHS